MSFEQWPAKRANGRSSKIVSAAVVAVALMMIVLVLVPARVWHHPVNDAVYNGFDRNLIYANSRGRGSADGLIDVSPAALKLTALPGSEPTVDLVTSPLSFTTTMKLRMLQGGSTTSSFRVAIWSPTVGSGYDVKFGPAPTNTVSAEVIAGGAGSTTLPAGQVVSVTPLGTYVPGQQYRLSMSLDKKSGTISTSISSLDLMPFSGQVLTVGDAAGQAEAATSIAIPVAGSRLYEFGGWVDYLDGTEPYAIGIMWFDKQGAPLPFANWWRPSGGLNGWTKQDLQVTAPPSASKATVFLGSGAGSRYQFAHVYLQDANNPGVNLLNGDFASGGRGWVICQPPGSCAGPPHAPDVTRTIPLDANVTVDAAKFPGLFSAFRPTLEVSLSGGDENASVLIEQYVVTLPSQPASAAELVEKVDDMRPQLLTILLSVLGGLLCVVALGRWASLRLPTRNPIDSVTATRVIAIRLWPLSLIVVALIAYLAVNSFLFHLGTPHFDTYASKIWSYIAAQYSVLQLYHLPFLTPATSVLGTPSHEASFPYGPTMTYYYLFVGWLYRLLLSPPGSVVADTFQFEFLLKSFNVLFALGDAVLVYLIVTSLGIKPARARTSVALFILNPALMFIMSVWGSTETISLFFILSSIWLAQKNLQALAWIALLFGSFTRPQMLILAFLLGCVYLRTFSVASNVRAISWSVVVFFVALTPLAIGISPSLPVDYVVHIFGFQVGSGQPDAFTAISPGYYSVWTLPLLLMNGQHGINRMWYPRTTELWGSITYGQASTLLVVAFLVGVAVLLLLRRSEGSMARHLPLVAFGVLGWLMLMDNLISRYFLYGLVLLILSRHAFRNGFYWYSVGWLSLVTLVSAWSHLGIDELGYHAVLNPLNPATNPVTREVMGLFLSDRFITAGTLANIALLVLLGFFAVKGTAPPIAADQRAYRLAPQSVAEL